MTKCSARTGVMLGQVRRRYGRYCILANFWVVAIHYVQRWMVRSRNGFALILKLTRLANLIRQVELQVEKILNEEQRPKQKKIILNEKKRL